LDSSSFCFSAAPPRQFRCAEVHLPDVWTSLVTAIAGVVWTFIYYRYRCLLPLAFSHAALGTAFYYGICGHDLAQEWKAAVHGL